MPIIATIKPDGTGDYTSLAAWEDAVDGASTADQHAECYAGGNLGTVTLNGWSSTPDSTNYPRIYAAEDNAHFGSTTAGAFISSGETFLINSYIPYTRIEGLRLNQTSTSGYGVSFSASGSSNGCRVEECLIHGSFAYGIAIGNTSGTTNVSFYLLNNIILIDGTDSNAPVGVSVHSTTSSSVTANVYIYNNTLYVTNAGSLQNTGFSFIQNGANNAAVYNIENNISCGGAYTDCFKITFSSGNDTTNFNHNISSDTSASPFTGLNNQYSRTDSLTFKNPSGLDLTPILSALDNGKTISIVQTDAFGTVRPFGDAYDIGAIEYFVIPVTPQKFEIPIDVIESHEYVADALLEGPLGHKCDLVYPVTRNSICPNCVYSPRKKKSSNMYKTGGPVFFKNNTVCPWCGGSGKSSKPVTEEIKLRIYWSQKEWSIFGPIENPDSSAMIIGFMRDLPKIEKADRILLNKDTEVFRKWVCERSGEAIPWGLAQDRYFAQMLRRVGGG